MSLFNDIFGPSWKHSVSSVRVKAVETLTDDAVLALIAKTDISEWVRREAVKRLIDQTVLAEVAKTDREWSVRALPLLESNRKLVCLTRLVQISTK